MKSRSHHRLPAMEPPDDWVNGSWTVDCVCGVNFDDGEEMVNCDECGVWVHTRCSRYVKGEKSFACDKCKNKNPRNDCEETEVAQLLVELPTKTLRMDNPYAAYGPPRRPFRLWTDRPIEERVHVQGIPGGEPSLFGGLSSIFTPELWKCTGYVPKKFNFQYKEFPCWDEQQEVNDKTDEENENPVDKGAGVLFSLSKNVLATAAVSTSFGTKEQAQEVGCNRPVSSKDIKKGKVYNMDVRSRQNDIEKDGTALPPSAVHSAKRKTEDSGTSKDQGVKKKIRLVHRDGDRQKRDMPTSITGEAKQLDFNEAGGSTAVKTETQSMKRSDSTDTVHTGPLSGDQHVVENIVDKSTDKLPSSEQPPENNAFDVSRHTLSIGATSEEERAGLQGSTRTEDPLKTDDSMISFTVHNDLGIISTNDEVVGSSLNKVNDSVRAPSISAENEPKKSECFVEKSSSPVFEGIDNKNCQDPVRSLKHEDKVKTEVDLVNLTSVEFSTCVDPKLDDTMFSVQHSGASSDHVSLNLKTSNIDVASPRSNGFNAQGDDQNTEAADGFPLPPCQPMRQVEASEGPTSLGRSSTDLKLDLRIEAQSSKVSSKNVIPQAPSSQRKSAASPSSSSTILISSASVADKHKPSNSQNPNSVAKVGVSDGNNNVKKDKGATVKVRGEDRHEIPRKILKEHSKSSFSSVYKGSHTSKSSHASVAKKPLLGSKESVLSSSSKTSSTQNIGVTPGSAEPSNTLQTQNVLHVQNKASSSGLLLRGEKISQSNTHSANKVNHSVPGHPSAPSNSPATLSDEELALLLHQELNSSPRVPRVPRMRQAGSLPQLGSPTATSTLIKRSSNSGGRDHSVVARRKGKDSPKEGSQSSRDIDNEAKDRLPLSPGPKNDKSARAPDAFSKREAESSGKGVNAVKKSTPSLSSTTASSGPLSPSEASEQKSGSARHSLRSTSDDDAGSIRGPAHHTLPGLIAEIMSQGKRMTYEELCNAVLPHWPNLRKHNGERYAYSSHSQAVLDCLRNRHEWAQLVDRGPKTNAGRKRRKTDTEAPSYESEDNDYEDNTTAKQVERKSSDSHREEFPKGKRKARKRGRLALQGRHIKDVRRRRKANLVSDDGDDNDSFSSSSEDSMFGEDEMQGGTFPNGSEALSSSDEIGTLS